MAENFVFKQTGAELQAIIDGVETIDQTPTEGSKNPVESGGVAAALEGVETALQGVDDALEAVDTRIDGVDTRIDGVDTALAGKQATLESGTNIKTINGQSILGSGNLTVGDANAVKNLAGSASGHTTVIKAGNDSSMTAEMRMVDASAKVQAAGGSVEVNASGVALQAGNSGAPNAKVTYNGQEVATKKYVDDAIEAIDVTDQIAGKADRVANAVSGDFAGLDANGNLTDSGKKASDFATAEQGTKADNAIQAPTGGTIGQVLTKTADGVAWDDASGGGSGDAVLYTEQTLTDEQKAQARTNIGAQTSMTIGTTTTVQPGVDASVANSGTAQAPVLDFFIPRGEKGEKGDTVILGGEATYTLYNATGDATDGAMTQATTSAAIKAVDDRVKEQLGGADVAFAEPESVVTGKYVASAGRVNSSSNTNYTVEYLAIPEGIAKIEIYVPNTSSTANYPISLGNSSTQTTGLRVVSGAGNSGPQSFTIERDVFGDYSYLIVSYNNSGGVPTVVGKTALVDLDSFTREADLTGIDFSATYTQDDCQIGNTIVKKTDGTTAGGLSGYFCSDYIEMPAQEFVITTDYTLGTAALVAFYDAEKTFIGYLDGGSMLSGYSYSAPASAKYMRLTTRSSSTLVVSFSAEGAKAVLLSVEQLIRERKAKSVNILCVGNSFTGNTTANLGTILGNLGVEGISINKVQVAYSSLQYWDENFATASNPTALIYGNALGRTATLENILKRCSIDIVVVQQVSTSSGTYSSYVPYLASLINKIRTVSVNKSVKIAFGMTWGTYQATFANIVDAAKQMSDNHNFIDYLIPLGTAIESARVSPIAEGHNDFSSDSSIRHLAAGFGEYTAACAFYQYLLEPLTNIPITEDTTTIEVSGGLGELAVTADNRGLAHQFAINASILKYTPVAIS